MHVDEVDPEDIRSLAADLKNAPQKLLELVYDGRPVPD